MTCRETSTTSHKLLFNDNEVSGRKGGEGNGRKGERECWLDLPEMRSELVFKVDKSQQRFITY